MTDKHTVSDSEPRHLTRPSLDREGFLVGEIELPGGLPPEPDDDEWEAQ